MQNDTHQTYTPDGLPPLAGPRKPNLCLPKGACDAHCHIFGPFNRYPLPADRSFNPNEAPETALRRLHEYLGIERAVIVQSQGHGLDHQPLLDALKAGQGRYRGIALLPPDTKPATVREYDEAGVRGVRFSFMPHLGMPNLDDVRTVIGLVRPVGWHVCIHVAGTALLEMSDLIRSIEPTVIIDHMARPDLAQGGLDNPVLGELLRLLDTGRVWAKLSGPERLSKQIAPFEDVVPVAKALLERAPERMLWGSDWPHVNLHGPMPDDGDLVGFIGQYATGDRLHQLLVENPQRLYNFTKP
jgi:2-pyrone-4,6-dicarboxylate lactonase